MLLRNRSRAVTKPSLMADQSPNQNHATTVPSLFGSPKFRDFTTKCLSGAEVLRSPTSILDTRALSPFGNPLSHDNNRTETIISSPKMQSEKRNSWDKVDSKHIGLALLGALKDETFRHNSDKLSNKKVLFGTELRVKIPSLPASSFESKTRAAEFGSRTKDSQKSVLSLSEMELSEDYTCVISHGPNPRTTHIFDNCVVESHCSVFNSPCSPSLNFLDSCYTCKKHLEQTEDIYIYRGEKAFCSQECRHQEMVLDGAEN